MKHYKLQINNKNQNQNTLKVSVLAFGVYNLEV